ncbi:MAG: hypothetical protein ACOCT0_04165 [Halobacteriota archaeon]
MPQQEYLTPGEFNSIFDDGPDDGERVRLEYISHATGETEDVVGNVTDTHESTPTAVEAGGDKYTVSKDGEIKKNGLEIGEFMKVERA